MTFDNLFDEGQPDSGAGVGCVGCILQPLEDAENFLMELGIDPNPVVLDVLIRT
jgi:hypothetical protein